MKKYMVLAAATLFAAGAWAQNVDAAMAKAGCTACHAKDKKVVGPSFHDIAAKYKGQDVVAKLMDKVRRGGSGVWGVVPMSPNPPSAIADADLKATVEFILKTP